MSFYNFSGDYIRSDQVSIDSPYAPITLVTDRFNQTINKANDVLELLIGTDGSGGLLGEMDDSLGTSPSSIITAPEVETSLVLSESGLSVPTFNKSELQTAPDETYTVPTLVSIPSVDVDFTDISLPEDISVAMDWAEAALPAEIYTALKTQILADLVDGSTGITGTVEEAIYTRARNRQQAANLSEYNKIIGVIGNMQHSLPSGVDAALLADFGMAKVRQEVETEAAIIENQAKLAQDNRKSAIQGAIALDQLIRQTRDGESTRALEGSKALQTLVVQEYGEKIRAFQALWEGKKAEVQAKAESVSAAVATNTGLIDVFKAQYDALKTRIDSVTSYNKSLTDVFGAEVQGFVGAERAIADKNDASIKLLEQQITDADMDLRAQIASATALIQSYSAEASVKERISEARSQICSQVAASLLSAVHAGASIGYSGSEGASKSYSVAVHGSESHNVEHDPEA